MAILSLVVLGARLQVAFIPYVLIAWIIAFVLLVTFNKINPRTYPIYLFGISLGLLWQTSLLGNGVVGADIQMEYYVSSVALNQGVAATNSYQYGASAVITMLAPFISRVLGIELIWIFKIILPIFLAIVPVIMYSVYKKLIDNKKALWASLFFIIVPVMSLELIGIAKAMVAELFFALLVLVIVSDLKQRYKTILLPSLILLTMLCHYSVGLVLWLFIVACFGMATFAKAIKKDWFVSKVSLATLAITLVVTTGIGYVYLSNVDNGSIIKTVKGIVASCTTNINDGLITMDNTPQATNTPSTDTTNDIYIANQSPLVRTGLGLDFLSSSIGGKAFRIVQYATQGLIVLGIIQLWRKRKEYKFTLEFVGLMVGGFVIIGACIVIPYFSNILNMTRFYQLSLFALSPLFVLGCELITKRRWFITTIMLVYFLFTSGLIYEITQSNIIEKVDMPYSYALSYERTGIVGVYNQDDINCAVWLAYESNQELPIVNDMNTLRLMQNYLDPLPRTFYIEKYYKPYLLLENNISGEYYIFLDTWNIEHNKLIYNYDISYPAGLRRVMDMPSWIYDLPVVYQSGDAVVYKAVK
jgi:uncharacterized membrane protein